MKDINSLSEFKEYIRGKGFVCEVSYLYSFCEKIEKDNTLLQKECANMQAAYQKDIAELQARIKELE